MIQTITQRVVEDKSHERKGKRIEDRRRDKDKRTNGPPRNEKPQEKTNKKDRPQNTKNNQGTKDDTTHLQKRKENVVSHL